MASDPAKSTLQNAALRIVAGTATHPLELAKFLIQIGHEPVAPQATTTLFGRPALALPNVFQYLRHIKKVDGLAGCYRGLGLKLISQSVSVYAYHCTSEVLKGHEMFSNTKKAKRPSEIREEGDTEDSEDEDEDEEGIYDEDVTISERRIRFLKQLATKLTCRSVAVIMSQPFHVAAFRAMAQFVGRETKYNGTVGAIVGVYREGGVLGFFAGISPRLACELTAITISASLTYFVRTYIVQDKALANIIGALMGFISSTVTYPFHVVTSCMMVKGSSLKAGQPPQMPGVYTSWIGCWSYLKAEGHLMRGNSLLWRYYTGPQVIIGGRAIPLEPFKAYN